MYNGSCLCGNVTFQAGDTTRGTSVCHCSQCRKQSGYAWSSAVVMRDDITIRGEITWYAASDVAKRGFCATCGSTLFWSHNDEPSMSYALGALDGPTDLKLEKHIFVQDKGDYYDIADGLPQHQK